MEGVKYSYARVSTDDHAPALQLAALKKVRRSHFQRRRFIRMIDAGERREDVAALLNVNRTTLYRGFC
jgi:DNA invertase Pin-like site-specific DNA recombinase